MKRFLLFLIALVAVSCAVPLDQINGNRITGEIILQVVPSDAEVYLDGTYIGHADKFDGAKSTLRVVTGGHVLKFLADDFENEMREVIAKEQPQIVVVKMLPKPRPAAGE
jgi:hypothetical protein